MANYQHWYYINKDYEEDGPVSSEDLQRMAQTGEIHRGTYVWTQELVEWVPASKVGGLFKEKAKEVVKPLADGLLTKKTGGFTTKADSGKPKKSGAAMKPLSAAQSQKSESNPIPSAPAASPSPSSPSAPGTQPGTPPLSEPGPLPKPMPIPDPEPASSGPVPMTAPMDIVPKPLTSAQP